MRIVLMVLALLSISTTASATPPADRLEQLSRGINLSHWFAQSDDYRLSRLTSFVGKTEIVRLRAAGFRHARLSVEPMAIGQDGFLTSLLAAIETLLSAGLAVVVDLHPVGDTKQRYRTTDGRAALLDVWDRLARRLAPLDPSRVLIEVLNEPHPLERAEWRDLQDDLVRTIRRHAPHHTLIVNPGGWSGIADLIASAPLADTNVVYAVHWYGPLLFTHQGADWTWALAKRIGPVGWPVAARGAHEVAHSVAPDEEARTALVAEIAAGRFEAAFVEAQFAELAAWRKRHGVAVYVGEFGVYALRAPRPAALAWVAATRASIERHGFGWAYWDSSPSFGLVAVGAQGRTLRPDMLSALGLPAP